MNRVRSGYGVRLIATTVCTAILATFGVVTFEPAVARAASSYVNPLSALSGLQPARIDQGVDYFASSGNILAVGDGSVNYESTNSGWNPGGKFISYKLTDGPATGYWVYVAECINLLVPLKQPDGTATPLYAGEPIASIDTNCSLAGSGCSTFCIETGWACSSNGVLDSAEAGQYCTNQDQGNYAVATAYGCNFNAMLTWLGAPSGTSSCTQPLNNPPTPSTWPTWPPGTGNANEQATVVRQPPGNLQTVFVSGTNHHGFEVTEDIYGTPNQWNDMGGVIKGSPSGVWNLSGTTLDAFAIGTDDHIYHIQRASGSTWGSWTQVPPSGALGISGSAVTESVYVDRRPDGGMDLFIRGAGGDAQHASLDAAGNLLKPWESLGGVIKAAPSGRWNSLQTRLDVYVIDTNDNPEHIVWTSSGWSAWSGGIVTGRAASAGTEAIMATRGPGDTMDVFLEGTDGAAWHGWTDSSGNIVGWESLGGRIKGAPDGEWSADQSTLTVLVIGTDDRPYVIRWNHQPGMPPGCCWSSWSQLRPLGMWGW
jgi:hypothetical protein